MPVSKILPLLNEKESLFRLFETHTENMLDCSSELLKDNIDMREGLIEKIDELDFKIKSITDELEDGEIIQSAIKGRIDYSDLPEYVIPVFETAAKIRSIISRLPEVEIQVSMRLRVEQEHLLNLIKLNNKGVSAQAAKFYSGSDSEIQKSKGIKA